jgi:hypothetical protein
MGRRWRGVDASIYISPAAIAGRGRILVVRECSGEVRERNSIARARARSRSQDVRAGYLRRLCVMSGRCSNSNTHQASSPPNALGLRDWEHQNA